MVVCMIYASCMIKIALWCILVSHLEVRTNIFIDKMLMFYNFLIKQGKLSFFILQGDIMKLLEIYKYTAMFISFFIGLCIFAYTNLLYSTGNSTPYYVITYMGKESEKGWRYIYIYIYIHTHTHTYLNHFAVHLKLTL